MALDQHYIKLQFNDDLAKQFAEKPPTTSLGDRINARREQKAQQLEQQQPALGHSGKWGWDTSRAQADDGRDR